MAKLEARWLDKLGERINKMWYTPICTTQHYLILKRNEILTHGMTQRNTEYIKLSETGQSQKNTALFH